MIDLNKLEELALAARDNDMHGGSSLTVEFMAFIDELTPAVAIDLIALIRKQEAQLESTFEEIGQAKDRCLYLEGEIRSLMEDRNADGSLPELPEWTKRDDLGGLVPSEIRQSVTALMREAWNRGLNYGLAPVAVQPGDGELPALPWQTKESRGDLAAWLEARSDTEIADAFSDYGRLCLASRQPAPVGNEIPDQAGDIFDLIREWAHLPEGQRGDVARQIIGHCNQSYMAGVKDTRALVAAENPAHVADAVAHFERHIEQLKAKIRGHETMFDCMKEERDTALAQRAGSDEAKPAGDWKVGSLLSVTLDEYPGMGGLFAQVWEGDDLIARVYGNDADTVRSRANLIASTKPDSERDAARLDWLVQHIVEVRAELRYGSKFLFVSQAKYDDEEFVGTTLREQIDAAMAAHQCKKSPPLQFVVMGDSESSPDPLLADMHDRIKSKGEKGGAK